MTNTNHTLPICSLLSASMSICEDRFYPALSSLVVTGEASRIVMPNRQSSWWADAYQQGLPAVGGRYQFLRGAWLPGGGCAGLQASASWGACAPSTGEAC